MGILTGLIGDARHANGPSPSPGQIVAWARLAALRMHAESGKLPGDGVPGRAPCRICGGRGVTPDGCDWCAYCRMGFVDAQHACPRCDGAEWVRPMGGGDSIACPSCQGAEEPVMRSLARAGVPDKYKVLTLEGWSMAVTRQPPAAIGEYRRAYRAARDLAIGRPPADPARPGLLLIGSPGRMKSGLAAGVVTAAAKRAARVHWIAWAAFGDHLNALREAGDGLVEVEIGAAATADVLVIDDLGVDGITSDYRTRVLTDIVERRGAGPAVVKPTIVTTMLGLTELETRYGSHVVSRLIEVCTPITLAGIDARRPA